MLKEKLAISMKNAKFIEVKIAILSDNQLIKSDIAITHRIRIPALEIFFHSRFILTCISYYCISIYQIFTKKKDQKDIRQSVICVYLWFHAVIGNFYFLFYTFPNFPNIFLMIKEQHFFLKWSSLESPTDSTQQGIGYNTKLKKKKRIKWS